MSGTKIEILGVDEFQIISDKLLKLENPDPKLQAALHTIGRYLVSETQLRFEAGETPEGKKWLQSKAAKKRQGQTLIDRTHLLKSITYNILKRALEVGSDLVYAAIHQLGGWTGRNLAVYLPARPFLGLNRYDKQEIIKIIEKYLI